MESVLVLVGTDFSEGARAALVSARILASHLRAELLVVHVMDPATGKLRGLDDDARRWLHDCDVSHRSILILDGTPWLELTREARSRDASVVVVGRHGRSGYQPIELGSTAAHVGLAAPCPVLLVAERTPGRSQTKFWYGGSMPRPAQSQLQDQ